MDLKEANIMNKKCIGCGASLQNEDAKKVGYIEDIHKDICNRCFRIRHYADYQKVDKDNLDYISILEEIAKTGDLVIFVADLFLWSKQIKKIISLLKNPILFVLTKRDVLPYRVADETLEAIVETLSVPVIDTIVISSTKSYHFDALYEKINQYKTSDRVYVVGCTNAGKSTMINTLMYHYAETPTSLTTSIMPSTTIDCLEIPMHEHLTLIDTPGILITNSFMNEVSGKELKIIMPKKEIKPITYQIKGKQYIRIDAYAQIEVLQDTNITLYFSNTLCIERFYKPFQKQYPYKREIKAFRGQDIVIEGLGFIKCSKNTFVTISLPYDIDVYVRESLI